jgi:hypothetical protein
MRTQHLYKILLLISVLGLTSCEIEDNLMPEGQWTLSEPNINAPVSEELIVMDERTPNETITFSWEESVSSAGYSVKYSVVLDTLDSDDFSTPILSKESSNNGTEPSVSITYQELDEALAYSGYTADSEASLSFAVIAQSLSKTNQSTGTINIKRFPTEVLPTRLFISGSATENENNLSEAILMKRLNDENGTPSNTYEVYTSLTAGESFKFYSEQSLPALQYGGSDGDINSFGESIIADEDGQFRIRVNLDDNTYELLKIDFWSMVGTPIAGGWGGDQPLEYQGGGVWKASLDLIETGGFAFRANGDWGYLLKRVVGSSNTLVLENDAQNQGVTVEDIPNNVTGKYFVTLDLSANAYTYSFEEDNTVIEPIDPPTTLYLLENGDMVQEFTKDGDVFSVANFIPMQTSANYTLNTMSDGSGTSYSINGNLGESTTPDGDVVSNSITLVENDSEFSIVEDRAFRLEIDFSAPQVNWTYYNFKLFHWSEWEQRDELVMTYQHPNTYTITTSLNAGFESKFISPWDFDLGSDAPSSLTGNLINGGGANIVNIDTDGTYQVTIELESDYESGTYEFVQQ